MEFPIHEVYRGIAHEIKLLKKVRLEIAVNNEYVDQAVEAITTVAKKEEDQGRGKIFIIHGKPRASTSEYNPNTNINRLIWTYESGKIFIFEDRGSFGHYYLVNQGF